MNWLPTNICSCGKVTIVLFLIFFGCEENNEIAPSPDTTSPTLEVTSSLNLDKLIFGQVEFEVSVSDESDITSVDFIVDNETMSSTTNLDHVFVLDTKTINDGIHIIKISTSDTNGNVTIKEYTTTVRNVLYRFVVGDSYVHQSRRRWVYLSDLNGADLDVKELSNNAEIVFQLPPSHTQESIYSFTLVDYLSSAIYNQVTLATMVDIKPGDFILDVIASFSHKDRHYLNVSNVDAENVLTAGSVGDYVVFNSLDKDMLNNSIKITTTFSNEGSHDLIYYINQAGAAPKYLKVEEVLDEETTEVDVDDFLPMLNKIISVPGAQSSYHMINYFIDPSDFFNVSSTGIYNSTNPEQIILYYPETEYSLFTTQLGVTLGDIQYTFGTTSSEIASNFEFMDASLEEFSQAGNVIYVTASGVYDYSRFIASSISGSAADLSINMTITKGNLNEFEFTTTVIPEEIIGSIPGLSGYIPKFDRAVFYEYSGMAGFEDFVKYRFENNISLAVNSEKFYTKEIRFE